jgi:hypothetical protein
LYLAIIFPKIDASRALTADVIAENDPAAYAARSISTFGELGSKFPFAVQSTLIPKTAADIAPYPRASLRDLLYSF